jgi:uncharacterized protein YpmB
MKQLLILVKETTLIKQVLDLAKKVGLKIDESNYHRTKGEVISIGTSKKYDVAGNNNINYYNRKHPTVKKVLLNKNHLSEILVFIKENGKVVKKEVSKSISKTVEKKVVPKTKVKKTKNVPNNVITSLYAKVKGNKKSPSKYFIKLKDNDYIASSIEEGSLGNLQELFESI